MNYHSLFMMLSFNREAKLLTGFTILQDFILTIFQFYLFFGAYDFIFEIKTFCHAIFTESHFKLSHDYLLRG